MNIFILDLKRKIKTLEVERRESDERIASLTQIIYQFNSSNKLKRKQHLKPFVSTVKSNQQFPDVLNCETSEKCNCISNSKKSTVSKELEKLRNDLVHADHIITILKKQEEEKDREIERLQCLFVGGRPVSALAKDCCYKDVSKITGDVGMLQKNKLDLQLKISEFKDENEKLQSKTNQQKEKIHKLESFVREISDAALYVEREANLKIKNQNREIHELKEVLSLSTSDSKSQELKNMRKKMKEQLKEEQKMIFEIEYLKNKLNEVEQSSKKINNQLIEDLMTERDLLQTKVKNLESYSEGHRPPPHIHTSSTSTTSQNPAHQTHHHQHVDNHSIYSHLKDKEFQIAELRKEIECLKRTNECIAMSKGSHTALNLTNHIKRVECERDCALNKIQSLKIECESLNDKIKIMSDVKLSESKKFIHYEETISKLKLEISDLHCAKTPAFQTIKQLREDNCELQIKLRSTEDDYNKLKSTFNQLKMISHQTESVLLQSQNQVEFTKCELNERESQICSLSKSNECLKEQIEKLSNEISKLKSAKSTAEREKDFYMMTLDKKTEKLQSIECKAESATQLREFNRKLKSDVDDLNCEIKRLESILCDTRSENACLCKQLESTKHHLTNAIHENGRMADELSSITAELNATKKRLIDSQKDSEVIRTKLQSYIHEIERIDGLIAIKDTDRKTALIQAKDLECDNIKLIEKFDQNACETKRTITELEHQIVMYQERVKVKDDDIEALEKQIIDLTTELDILRDANAKIHADLEAQRNLCEKLDIQKEKQEAELMEYELSVRELIDRNDKLREDILLLREGNTSEIQVSASYHPTM